MEWPAGEGADGGDAPELATAVEFLIGPTDTESCGASAYATVRAAAEPDRVRVARGEEG